MVVEDVYYSEQVFVLYSMKYAINFVKLHLQKISTAKQTIQNYQNINGFGENKNAYTFLQEIIVALENSNIELFTDSLFKYKDLANDNVVENLLLKIKSKIREATVDQLKDIFASNSEQENNNNEVLVKMDFDEDLKKKLKNLDERITALEKFREKKENPSPI